MTKWCFSVRKLLLTIKVAPVVPGVSAALVKFQLKRIMKYAGYLIFEQTSHTYKGIDRNLFEPILIDGELDPECLTGEKVWEFYPAGWKRNAYKLYEENSFGNESISIIRSEQTAALLVDMINKHSTPHEIIFTNIIDSIDIQNVDIIDKYEFLGIDVAYIGGNFYSAIKNGLIINGNQTLFDAFGLKLNSNLLFSDLHTADLYRKEFMLNVRSERDSDFHLYMLYRVS